MSAATTEDVLHKNVGEHGIFRGNISPQKPHHLEMNHCDVAERAERDVNVWLRNETEVSDSL